VFDFFRTLFKPAPPSSATAKERLKLVLLSDHLSLAPDVIDALKRDLLGVISRYVEIDVAHADVTFEHRENDVAMLANVPITGVRARPAPLPPRDEAAASEPEPAVAEPSEAEAPLAKPVVAATSAHGAAPRRRRRKKSGGAAAAAKRPQQPPVGNPAQA
jgi:cell division topological specificity factor